MWNVSLYKNTGLNSVNTLRTPFNTANADINLPALDILQAEFLTTVNVKATRDQVKGADFLILQNDENPNERFYYSVESFTPTSVDVQVLSITFDALMTLIYIKAGIENIEILDGIVERHTINEDDDVYGRYTEEDPLLVPSNTLGFIAKQMYMPQYNAEGDPTDVIPQTVIQSRVNLTTIGKNATTYTDASSGEKVTIPDAPDSIQSNYATRFNMQLSDGDGQPYVNSSTQLYLHNNSAVLNALRNLRNLGIENGSIVASYTLIQNFDYEGTGTPGFLSIKGKYIETEVPSIEFDYDDTIKNKRVLYGSCNKFELISVASGVRMEFKPEDICFDEDVNLLKYPRVCRASDPRPEGRPYYGFKFYRSVNQFKHTYLANVVPGMSWPSVPIVYTGLSGSNLNEIRYNTEREGAKLAGQQDINSMNYNLGESAARRTIDLDRSAIGAIGQGASNPIGAIASFAGSYMNASAEQAFDQSRAQFNKTQLEERYAYNARKELQALKISNTIVEPDVHFPNSETLRDFLGNGVYVIQYRPTAADRQKMDKILTMYGYKDTKVLEASDFVTRKQNTHFAYVKANSVSIGGTDVPRWIREAAAAQISNGVRIWTTAPSPTEYNKPKV